jgi:rhodanese-related sulfurtransferase
MTLSKTAVGIAAVGALVLGAAQAAPLGAAIAAGVGIYQATLQEAKPITPEVSTAELQDILAQGSAVVFDARPHMEYAISHIPGALNAAALPGVSKAQYVSDVAEIGRVLNGDKTKAIVLYYNDPFCPRSKLLSEELKKVVGALEIGKTRMSLRL